MGWEKSPETGRKGNKPSFPIPNEDVHRQEIVVAMAGISRNNDVQEDHFNISNAEKKNCHFRKRQDEKQ